MVRISTYKTFWEYIAAQVPGITRALTVHEAFDIAGMVKDYDTDDVTLLFIVPSGDTEAPDIDNIEEFDTCYVFILKKCSRRDQDNSDFLTVLDDTQGIMIGVKNKLLELAGDFDKCLQAGSFTHMMHKLVINGMHMDPEYNLFGMDGWGLSFKLKTNGTEF